MTDHYTADVEWADRQWQATVRDLPGAHTYARTTKALRRRLREVIVLMAERPDSDLHDEDSFTVGLDVRVSGSEAVGASGESARPDVALQHAADMRRRAAEAEAEADHATRVAVLLAQDAGVSVRDAAALLGISHQRVQQLLQRARRDPAA